MIARARLAGLGLGLLATVFWASLYVVTRLLFGNFTVDPLTLTFLRFLMASVFFVGLAAAMGRGRELFRALVRHGWTFAFLGLIGVFMEGALQFYSLQYTTAVRSCLFSNATPILTVLIAAVLLKDPVTPRIAAGMAVGLLAIILGMGQAGSDQFMGRSSYTGDLLALMSAVCWSVYTVGGIGVTRQYGGLISASAAMLAGTAITLAFLLATGRPVFPRHARAGLVGHGIPGGGRFGIGLRGLVQRFEISQGRRTGGVWLSFHHDHRRPGHAAGEGTADAHVWNCLCGSVAGHLADGRAGPAEMSRRAPPGPAGPAPLARWPGNGHAGTAIFSTKKQIFPVAGQCLQEYLQPETRKCDSAQIKFQKSLDK